MSDAHVGDGGDEGDPTVLVVEDDADVVETYRLWLADEYEMRSATDGAAALETIDDDVDVTLLDRLMPGLSGKETLDRIRDAGYDCRVAMVTAVEPDFDILEMGFDAYLTKPVTESGLLGTVEELLARSTYADTLDRYTRLLAKREALRASKSGSELRESEEYGALREEMAALNEELDPTLVGVGENEGFVATIRGIDEEDVRVAGRDEDEGESERGAGFGVTSTSGTETETETGADGEDSGGSR
jgi:CheY-like chemotaxis protein